MPTYVYPFLLAIVAAAVGWVLSRRPNTGEADYLASRILYMVALGCVIIGFATYWLWNKY